MRLGYLKKNRRKAASIIMCIVCTLYGVSLHTASAGTTPPIPAKKPSFAQKNPVGFDVIGLAKNFLDNEPSTRAESEFADPLIKKYAAASDLGPLSTQDQNLYKEIFILQERGDMPAADEKIKQLKNPRLYGHVLYQRYMHPTAYSSSFEELQNWLEVFGDHPHADKIYKLAGNKGTGALRQPPPSFGVARVPEPTMRRAKPYISSKARSEEEATQVAGFKKAIKQEIRSGEIDQALRKIKGEAALDRLEKDVLLAEAAAALMYQGHKTQALNIAQSVTERSGVNAPKAAWVAGLMNWKDKRYSKAASDFEMAARSPYASGWMLASASYWAARSHMRVGNVKAVSTWLRRGTQYPRTFYGLISTRALGHDFNFNWQVPTFTREMRDILYAMPAGARAMGLVQARQFQSAQAELLRIKPDNQKQQDALLAFAGYANLPGLSMRLANIARPDEGGNYYDAALYPIGPWKPKDNFKIDEALVNAIVRQESRFDPDAESPSGAKGLMQLMPATARAIAGEDEIELDHPETNLDLGQNYLQHLMKSSRVKGDLLSLLIAYNAGPGNLAKWKSLWPDVKDPLLFIELLPSSETRAYVERVLSNYWIYRMRAGEETPSLDQVAAGKPAKYASVL